MVAEAKAAAAAVLRSPPGSSAASRMLAAEADEQERQQRWRGSRTPERMPNNSSRSPRHGKQQLQPWHYLSCVFLPPARPSADL